MPNLFEHFKASAAYVHKTFFINIVQASEMPNLFGNFTKNKIQIFQLTTNCIQLATRSVG